MDSAFLVLMVGILGVWVSRLYLAFRTKNTQFFLERDTFSTAASGAPLVSILIPALNEEKNIGYCLESLRKLDYPNFEVLVVDDRSTDNTAAIVEDIARKDDRIRLIRNTELAQGWSGKSFALHQAQKQAGGSWLLFSDADTTHAPESLSQVYAFARQRGLKMVTLLPDLVGETFWEKFLQPIAAVVLMIHFPLEKSNNPDSPVAFANGQYIFLERATYDSMGGHQAVREHLLEDIALAKQAKAMRIPMRVVPTPSLFKTRMYKTFSEICKGWSRIYYYIFERQLWRLCASIVGMFTVSVFPVLLFFGLLGAWMILEGLSSYAWTVLALTTAQVIVMRWAVWRYYRITGSNPLYSLFNPIGVMVILGILTGSIYKIYSGKGTSWRGTTYTQRKGTAAPVSSQAVVHESFATQK